MRVSTRQVGNIIVVDLEGRLIYGAECEALRTTVKDLLDAGETRILINLAEVPNVDSGGIGTLVSLYTSAKNAGGDLRLWGANDKVHHSLDLTRILTVIKHFKEERKAISSFQGASPASA